MSMSPGAGNPDPTVPIPPVGGPESFASGDPTVAVPVATGGPPRSGAPGGGAPGGPQGGGTGDGEAGDNRKWWWIVGAVVAIIIIAIIILLATGGDSGKSTSSSTSSTSSTTTTAPKVSTTAPATTTTAAPAPQILQFSASPNPVTCPDAAASGTVTLTWSSQSASSATVSIDNPGSAVGTFGPSGQQQFTFACGASPLQHTYYLQVSGSGGQTSQKSILVAGNISP